MKRLNILQKKKKNTFNIKSTNCNNNNKDTNFKLSRPPPVNFFASLIELAGAFRWRAIKQQKRGGKYEGLNPCRVGR